MAGTSLIAVEPELSGWFITSPLGMQMLASMSADGFLARPDDALDSSQVSTRGLCARMRRCAVYRTTLAVAQRAGNALAFSDGVDAVHRGQLDLSPSRPRASESPPFQGRSHRPARSAAVGRSLKCSCRWPAHRRAAACRWRSDTRWRTWRRAGSSGSAYQPHLHPVMMIGVHIPQQHRRAVDGVDHHIDLSVVEEIAKGRSPRRDHVRQSGALHRRNVFKLSSLAASSGTL